MNKLRFSKDWNHKLQCRVFTTIRKFNLKKYTWYQSKINEVFDVEVSGIVRFQARLCSVMFKKLNEIEPYLLFLDTGEDEPFKIFKKFGIGEEDEVIILLLDSKKLYFVDFPINKQGDSS